MNVNWAKQHCGVYQAPFAAVQALMPDLAPILNTFPDYGPMYTWDVKVHMLMPGQYPCIPGWHCDMVPRDENLVQQWDRINDRADPMWLWVSGAPITEFKDGRNVHPQVWTPFTQRDEHRGTMATEHGWRCFIRAVPFSILRPAAPDKWLRRHSQVYLNADGFKW